MRKLPRLIIVDTPINSHERRVAACQASVRRDSTAGRICAGEPRPRFIHAIGNVLILGETKTRRDDDALSNNQAKPENSLTTFFTD